MLVATGGISPQFLIGYIIFFIALMYFMAIRPQQKEKKKQEALLASIGVGDSILTSSGFYGVVIDMTDDTVIVEFGSNKNCRIPMQKQAIVQVEKPEKDESKGESHGHSLVPPWLFCYSQAEQREDGA